MNSYKAYVSFGIVYIGITIKIVVVESLVLEAVDIDKNNMHTEMILIKQVIFIIHLVYCPIILIKDKEKNLIVFLFFMSKNLFCESLFTI